MGLCVHTQHNALYKARLSDRGFTKKQEVNYIKIFCLVMYSSIQVLLAMVGRFDMEFEQTDVNKQRFFMVSFRRVS